MGCGRGLSSTQQSRTLLHGMGSSQRKVQPFAGVMQSHLGPTFTPGLVRKFSATAPVSATQAPAARSTEQARASHGAVAMGGLLGLSVQAPSRQRHSPGGGAESLHATGACGSTQRLGRQGSSQPQSRSERHSTTDRWSRPRFAAAGAAAETAGLGAPVATPDEIGVAAWPVVGPAVADNAVARGAARGSPEAPAHPRTRSQQRGAKPAARVIRKRYRGLGSCSRLQRAPGSVVCGLRGSRPEQVAPNDRPQPLETLLVTPLSERAILLGKVGAAVLFAAVVAVAAFLCALVTVNAVLSPPTVFVPTIGFAAVALGGALAISDRRVRSPERCWPEPEQTRWRNLPAHRVPGRIDVPVRVHHVEVSRAGRERADVELDRDRVAGR